MKKITARISPELSGPSGLRLDQALAKCPEVVKHGLSRSLLRKLVNAGAVYVNGKRVRVASRPMHGGEIIDLYWDESRTPDKPDAREFLPLRVLYEDDAIVCFDKPAGLPTQPTLDEARINLYQLAKEQILKQSPKSPYLGMHHRLDRDTSGVILFTRDTRYNAQVAEMFRSHACMKLYAAVVHGRLKKQQGRLESFLGPVGRQGKQSKFGSVNKGGKKAITDFLVLEEGKNYSLIEVKITTGRTHQIRVHFSEMGHPVAGDTLYGSPAQIYTEAGRHFLHAHALTLKHPVSGNSLRVESPLPQEFRNWVSR